MLNYRKGTVARYLLLCGLVAALALGAFAFAPVHNVAHADGPSVTGLHVQGNQLVNGSGQTIRLLGVDHSGTEFACVQGGGIFDGQTDDNAIAAMAAWHINAVRVPLNEDCWLAINGASPAGGTYQQAIADYVNRLNNHGLAVILDLHWNAPGGQEAKGQQPMPDEDHAPAFWSSVASYFKGNSSVLFDLYNEPYPDNNQDTTAGWQCWRDGGTCSGVSYPVAGMQQLVNVVRQAGASNVIMLGGLEYSNAFSQWLAYKPSDPDNNLAASWHSYNFNLCNNQGCWNSTIAPVAQQVPVIAGEIGENDCGHGYIDQVMSWLDSHGISYLGWTWNTWDCSSGPALITNYNGTPTAFGVGFRDHLAALVGSGGGNGTTGAISAPGGKCMDVAGANSTSGTHVQEWDCNGTNAQAWTVASDHTLHALGKCLDIIGNGTAGGTKVELWDCNGVGAQQWVPQSNGALLNPQSGRCLDDPGGNTANGTQLQIWDCNNLWPQVFKLP